MVFDLCSDLLFSEGCQAKSFFSMFRNVCFFSKQFLISVLQKMFLLLEHWFCNTKNNQNVFILSIISLSLVNFPSRRLFGKHLSFIFYFQIRQLQIANNEQVDTISSLKEQATDMKIQVLF